MKQKEVIIYLAGIIDGEGFLEIRKSITSIGNVCYSSRMGFFMQNKAPAELFTKVFGGKLLTTKMNKKDYYGIAIGGDKLEGILVKLLPYLQVKKQEAEYTLKLIRNRKEFPVHPIFENGKFRGTQAVPKEIQMKREKLFILCRACQNKKQK